jgi:hypothetical protein
MSRVCALYELFDYRTVDVDTTRSLSEKSREDLEDETAEDDEAEDSCHVICQ